jgi:hypothetical protein
MGCTKVGRGHSSPKGEGFQPSPKETLKAAGMDWTAVLVAEDENKRARIAAQILESTEYTSTAARVAAFIAQGGGCRATFFNHRRRLGNGTGRGPGG